MTPMGRNSTTNDMGEFRVFGLSPGQYFLTASLRGGGQPFYPNDNNDDRTGYAPTYYPGYLRIPPRPSALPWVSHRRSATSRSSSR